MAAQSDESDRVEKRQQKTTRTGEANREFNLADPHTSGKIRAIQLNSVAVADNDLPKIKMEDSRKHRSRDDDSRPRRRDDDDDRPRRKREEEDRTRKRNDDEDRTRKRNDDDDRARKRNDDDRARNRNQDDDRSRRRKEEESRPKAKRNEEEDRKSNSRNDGADRSRNESKDNKPSSLEQIKAALGKLAAAASGGQRDERRGERDNKDCKDPKSERDNKDAKGDRDNKDAKGDRDNKDAKGDRDNKDNKDRKGDRDNKDGKSDRDNKDNKDGKGDRDNKDNKDGKGDRDNKDNKDGKGDRDNKDNKDGKGDRDNKDNKDGKGDRDNKDDKDGKGDRDRNDDRDRPSSDNDRPRDRDRPSSSDNDRPRDGDATNSADGNDNSSDTNNTQIPTSTDDADRISNTTENVPIAEDGADVRESTPTTPRFETAIDAVMNSTQEYAINIAAAMGQPIEGAIAPTDAALLAPTDAALLAPTDVALVAPTDVALVAPTDVPIEGSVVAAITGQEESMNELPLFEDGGDETVRPVETQIPILLTQLPVQPTFATADFASPPVIGSAFLTDVGRNAAPLAVVQDGGEVLIAQPQPPVQFSTAVPIFDPAAYRASESTERKLVDTNSVVWVDAEEPRRRVEDSAPIEQTQFPVWNVPASELDDAVGQREKEPVLMPSQQPVLQSAFAQAIAADPNQSNNPNGNTQSNSGGQQTNQPGNGSNGSGSSNAGGGGGGMPINFIDPSTILPSVDVVNKFDEFMTTVNTLISDSTKHNATKVDYVLNNATDRGTHRVSEGQTLEEIAMKHYGDARYAELIYRMNMKEIPTKFVGAAKLRLNLLPNMNLQLPTKQEFNNFLQTGMFGRRKFEYEESKRR